jgi:hypothetical protein
MVKMTLWQSRMGAQDMAIIRVRDWPHFGNALVGGPYPM